jgi:hypothetical protein
MDKRAAFSTLRAVGAFLVSASCANGQVERVEILSEAGSTLRILNPWKDGARVIGLTGEKTIKDESIELPTSRGETIRLLPASVRQ